MLGELVRAVGRAGKWATHCRHEVVEEARRMLDSRGLQTQTAHAVAHLGAVCPVLAAECMGLLVQACKSDVGAVRLAVAEGMSTLGHASPSLAVDAMPHLV